MVGTRALETDDGPQGLQSQGAQSPVMQPHMYHDVGRNTRRPRRHDALQDVTIGISLMPL